MSKSLRIFLSTDLPAAIEARLAELYTLVKDDWAHAKGCAVIIPTLGDRIDATHIAALAPELKLIANFGAGVDHIDVAFAKQQKIYVSNTPSVLTEDTADVTLALLLAASRRLSEAVSDLRAGAWQGWHPLYMLGHRVHGKTLGIVGMGRIGQAVAKRARGFGLRVLYTQRTQLHASVEAELSATYVPSLESLLPQVDFLSLHCPHTPQTHHHLNAQRLALLKPSACIVNTARGALIEETALVAALANGKLAGAGLDVYAHAPHVPEALKALKNVTLLPHISSATIESREEMGQRVLLNIQSFADGHPPPDRVLLAEVG